MIVSVTLTPDDVNLSFSRCFNLSRETHIVLIGRASKRGPLPRIPALDNGWFESRVMSRNHAEIFFCLDKKVSLLFLDFRSQNVVLMRVMSQIVCIRDCASTHGTWLNDTKLVPGELTTLASGDTVRFGIDVERDEGQSTSFIFFVLSAG